MSFYSKLSFYSPNAPLILTGTDLAAFVSAFASLGLADKDKQGLIGYHVKFGRAIDQDEQPTDEDEPILFDIEKGRLPSIDHLANELAGLNGSICRSHLMLGHIDGDISDQVKRRPSKENNSGLVLDVWNLEIGPIESYKIDTDDPFRVGWVAVGMSGYGYLYPWSFRGLIDRAEAITPIRKLMDLCRRTWPVAPEEPSLRVIQMRKEMGDLWPYPDIDRPLDWYWGLVDGS